MTTNGSSAGELFPAEELLLPRPPGVLRRFWSRHPWLTDSLIAASYGVPALALALFAALSGQDVTPSQLALQIITAVLASAAIVVRRRLPFVTFVATCLLMVGVYPSLRAGDIVPVLFALYAVGVYRSVRATWITYAVAVVLGCVNAVIGQSGVFIGSSVSESTSGGVTTEDSWWGLGIQSAFLMLIAVLIGINLGNRRRYLLALQGRAAQLARERDQQAAIASAAERARIAREMHDVVAHSLSVVISLADGAAATAETDASRARAAMETVAETGRGALGEMRRLLGVLHEEGDANAPLAPQPSLAELAELVETFRNAGLPVRMEQTGVGPVDTSLQLAIYRIVQESLTNALRYAAKPTRVTVRLEYSGDRAVVEVTDNGRSTSTPRPEGRGIIGIQQRAALFGGTSTAGTLAAGGWHVRAELHHQTTAPRETTALHQTTKGNPA